MSENRELPKNWENQKMLDVYILDYMKRKNMHETAEIFAQEANVDTEPTITDSPEGFLREWWYIFWETFCEVYRKAEAEKQGAPAEREPDYVKLAEQFSQELSLYGMDSPLLSPQFRPIREPVPLGSPQFLPVPETPVPVSQGDMQPQNMPMPPMPFMPPVPPNMSPQEYGNMVHTFFNLLQRPELTIMSTDGFFPVPVNIPNPFLNPQAMNVMQPPNLPYPTMNRGEMQPLSVPSSATGGHEFRHAFGPDLSANAQIPIRPTESIIRELETRYGQPMSTMLMATYEQDVLRSAARGREMAPDFNLQAQNANLFMPGRDLHEIYEHGISRNIQQNGGNGARADPAFPNSGGQSQTVFTDEEGRELSSQEVQLTENPLVAFSSVSPALWPQGSNPVASQPSHHQQCTPAAGFHQNDVSHELAAEGSGNIIFSASANIHNSAVGSVSPALALQNSNLVASLPSHHQEGASAGGFNQNDLSHELAARTSGNVAFSASGEAVGSISSALGPVSSNLAASLASQGQQVTLAEGFHENDLFPQLAEQQSGYLVSSASGHALTTMPYQIQETTHEKRIEEVVHVENTVPKVHEGLIQRKKNQTSLIQRKKIQTKVPYQIQETMHGKRIEEVVQEEHTVPKPHEGLRQRMKNQTKRNTKRKITSSSKAGESAEGVKANQVENRMDGPIGKYLPFVNYNDDAVGIPFDQNSTACGTEPEGFKWEEIGSLCSSKNKLLNCDFSSCGKFFACAGDAKKVLIWNVKNFSVKSAEGDYGLVTDVRFRVNSTVFATSSFDTNILIWDALEHSNPQAKLVGHMAPVVSLDFHPKNANLLCSCDADNEVGMWNIEDRACIKVSKGGGRKLRFQPCFGNLLAISTGNLINLVDVQKHTTFLQLKGHAKNIRSFCWDITGNYIASVSEDSARIWSVYSGGKCIHELACNGNKFVSCVFHPAYAQLLVVGSYQALKLWNPIDGNRSWSYKAHEGVIGALAASCETASIASVSHDGYVKLWK